MSAPDDEAQLPEYPGHTAAFGRIMRTAYQGQQVVSSMSHYAEDLMKVRNDELVLLHQVRVMAKLMVWQETIAAEIARRNVEAVNRNEEALAQNREATEQSTAAQVAFKAQSKIASDRLEGLTRWLIAFTGCSHSSPWLSSCTT